MRQALRRCCQPSTANPRAIAANPRLIKRTNFCRSTLSAKVPAGGVKRKKGSDATVLEHQGEQNRDPVKAFIIQIAALSWAATQVPEITAAIQSFLKVGFRSAVQVELLVHDRGLSSRDKDNSLS